MERWFGGKNRIERAVKHFPILSNNVQPHTYRGGGRGRNTRVPSSSIQLYFSLSLVFFPLYHCAQRIPLLYKYGPDAVHYYTFPNRTSWHTIWIYTSFCHKAIHQTTVIFPPNSPCGAASRILPYTKKNLFYSPFGVVNVAPPSCFYL